MKSKMAVVSLVLTVIAIILTIIAFYVPIYNPAITSILIILIVLIPILSLILGIFSLFIIKKNNLEGEWYSISAIVLNLIILAFIFVKFSIAIGNFAPA